MLWIGSLWPPRSVGLHTRRQLQDAFNDMPLQLPTWLSWPLHLRPELLPLLACLTAWFQADFLTRAP